MSLHPRDVPSSEPSRELVARRSGGLPQAFGPYLLVERLATGDRHELLLALQRTSALFEKVVVVKRGLPAPTGPLDPNALAAFVQQARLAATLSHPNVVQTLDAGTIDGRTFVAMEHLAGPDLKALLEAVAHRGTRVPLEHALTIALAACAGLTYVHEKCDESGIPLGVLHRDLCTRHLIVTFAGDVKLVDLEIGLNGADEGEHTRRAALDGKAEFVAPEQVRGEAPDPRTDLYSLGVVLYELTTGRRPFVGRSSVETLTLIRDAPCPQPSTVAAGYPVALERVVLKALQKRPADRYPSARAMQADLEQFVRLRQVPISSASLGAWLRRLLPERLAREQELLRSVAQRSLASARPAIVPAPSEPPSAHVPPPPRALSSTAPIARTLSTPVHWKWGVWGITAGAAFVTLCAVLFIGRGILREIARRNELLRALGEAPPNPSAAAAPPAPAPVPVTTGTLELTSAPPGCEIWINGAPRPETTPATLAGLPIERELHVRLVKDGYDAYHALLKLTGEAAFQELHVEMKPLTATVLLQLEPPWAAVVWLDGKPWRGDGHKVDGLPPGEHKLTITANGYAARLAVTNLSPGETKSLTIKLVRE